MRSVVYAALCGSLVVALATSSAFAAAPSPVTAVDLGARFQAAVNARDAAGVDALVCWDDADDYSRDLTESMLGVFEAQTISAVSIEPLDAKTAAWSQMTLPNGNVYGAAVAPRYKLVAQYAHGPDVTEDYGSLVVGEKAGAWCIVALARLK